MKKTTLLATCFTLLLAFSSPVLADGHYTSGDDMGIEGPNHLYPPKIALCRYDPCSFWSARFACRDAADIYFLQFISLDTDWS